MVDLRVGYERFAQTQFSTLPDTTVAASRAQFAVVLPPQFVGGGDFAWFLQDVPGAMMRLGTHRPGGEEYDLHRGDYIVDEGALANGIRVLGAAALRSLREMH